MQRAAGVASFGDITQLLSTAPRDVVELLRIAGGFCSHLKHPQSLCKTRLNASHSHHSSNTRATREHGVPGSTRSLSSSSS